MTPEHPTIGWLGLKSRTGRSWTRVEVIGQTRAKVRIRATTCTTLAGRRVLVTGAVALVPRSFVVFGAAPPKADATR